MQNKPLAGLDWAGRLALADRVDDAGSFAQLSEQDRQLITKSEMHPQPKTASEWADYYLDQWLEAEPQQFMAQNQPRAADGKWSAGVGGKYGDGYESGGAGGGISDGEAQSMKIIEGLQSKMEGSRTYKDFRNVYLGTSMSFEINGHLRGTKPGSSTLAAVAKGALEDHAAISAPLPAAMTVQRAIRFRDGIPADFRKGAVITDNGFTSTTVSKKWTEYHSRGSGSIILNIELPKGLKVVPNKAEGELVIKPPSKYEITGRKGNTFTARLLT